jgi:aminoglycoside phosphotransferase (APT) family kinase protein
MSGGPVLVPVLPNHRFDEAALIRYLRAALPGFHEPCQVLQFQGGQSNPTFCLQTPGARYVLRKKPPGKLLPSAHAVEREYRAMTALAETEVPVPRMRVLCTDETVIGTAFYVMEYLDGRVFTDLSLPGLAPAERRAIFDDMNRVLAALHLVDFQAVGLGDFGRPQGYIARQIGLWSRQYAASGATDAPEMERLMTWLPEHLPAREHCAIAHGDYRLGNLMFHRAEPRVIAVLDWELATLGHPMADLAYNCLPWRLPPELVGFRGFEPEGVPSESEYVAAYAKRTNFPDVADLDYFVVFSLFRLAAILAGVYRRALDGNAADARGVEAGARFRKLAAFAWELAQSVR